MNNRLELPKLGSGSIGTWLTLLADRELPGDANQELTDFLDQNPQHWRECAIMLWDEFSLRAAYSESDQMSPAFEKDRASSPCGQLEATENLERTDSTRVLVPASVVARPDRNGSIVSRYTYSDIKRKTKTESRFKPMSMAGWGTVAAVLMMVFSAGWFASGKIGNTVKSDESNNRLLAEIGELKRITSNLAAGWAAEQSTLRTVADMFPDAPMLLEVESTPWRTIYLTDRPASDQMIRTLASMSENVTVEPYEPEIVTPLWRSLNRPVVAIEITKNDFPLLTGVQR